MMMLPQTWVQQWQMLLRDNVSLKLLNEEIVTTSSYQFPEATWWQDDWRYVATKFTLRQGYTMFFKYEGEGLFSVTFMDLQGRPVEERVPRPTLEPDVIVISDDDDDDGSGFGEAGDHVQTNSSSNHLLEASANPLQARVNMSMV